MNQVSHKRVKVNEKKSDRWEKVRGVWNIIERLRGDSGCPWDRKQTPETVQTYLVEESHEAAAAVRKGQVDEIAEELGDVLFMALFIIYVYEQRGDFGLVEVCERITEKMIRRHPHVFGEVYVDTAEEVKDNWEKIKAGEKNAKGKIPEPVPASLPALIRAYRVLDRVSRKENGGFGNLQDQANVFARKSQILADGIETSRPIPAEEFGELFLQLVNLTRLKGMRAEDVLHGRIEELEERNSSNG